MAKKKRKPDKNKRQPRNPDFIPDRRALEHGLRQIIAGVEGNGLEDTPLNRAQEVMYRAFDEPNESRRIQLANQALEICPDCADAYVLLAEHARTNKQGRELYAKGVAAGERALGPSAFQQHAGHFWGVLETRPYMRAREGLAHALWSAGLCDEAVQDLQDLLRLNPNDNQGVRYTLASFLLYLDRDDDLDRLLKQFDEDMATWAYTKALLAFRQQGDTEQSRQLLAAAKKANKHVPGYLLGRNQVPEWQPSHFGLGDESEAIVYIKGNLGPWRYTGGAIDWLRAHDEETKQRRSLVRQPKGPMTAIKKWLNERLPQEYDVWQAECRRQPHWVMVESERVRPWLIMVTSRSNDLVLAHQHTEERPSSGWIWDTLVEAMQHPAAGEPHRPSEIQVRSDECWESLRPHIEQLDVTLTDTDDLDHLDAMIIDMAKHLGGKAMPGLLDMPGVTADQVAQFYEAAALYFQKAPWKRLGNELAFKIECDKFQSGPWYGVVMGQSGLTLGLAVYDDLKALQRLWAKGGGYDETARRSVGFGVTFCAESDVPVADVEAAEHHGWKVARSEAWPSVFRKERGMSIRQPLSWELELLEGCLRAVPVFLKRRHVDDPAKDDVVVPAASGELRLVLSWAETQSAR